jgi:hypothetical protein
MVIVAVGATVGVRVGGTGIGVACERLQAPNDTIASKQTMILKSFFMAGTPPFFDGFYVFMVQLLTGKYTIRKDSVMEWLPG